MIMYKGEPVRVVTMACGYFYRLRPLSARLPSGYETFSRDSVIMNDDQLAAVVRKHYLEGK